MSDVARAVRAVEREKKGRDKLSKHLPPGFKDDADAMGEASLRDALVESEANLKRVDEAAAADEKLQGAKELIKDLRLPYAEAKKAQRAKIAYVLHRLEELGVLPDESEDVR